MTEVKKPTGPAPWPGGCGAFFPRGGTIPFPLSPGGFAQKKGGRAHQGIYWGDKRPAPRVPKRKLLTGGGPTPTGGWGERGFDTPPSRQMAPSTAQGGGAPFPPGR